MKHRVEDWKAINDIWVRLEQIGKDIKELKEKVRK